MGSHDAIARQADIQIDLVHSLVHQGGVWVVSDYDADVDNAAPKYWRITTAAAVYPHIQLALAVSASGLVQLYEGGTFDATPGTQLTAYNLNRNSSAAPSTTFFYDTVSTADGTLIDQEYVPGGDRLQTRVGSQARTTAEWVLKPSTTYYVKFTPDADDTKAAIEIEFYERVQALP